MTVNVDVYMLSDLQYWMTNPDHVRAYPSLEDMVLDFCRADRLDFESELVKDAFQNLEAHFRMLKSQQQQ